MSCGNDNIGDPVIFSKSAVKRLHFLLSSHKSNNKNIIGFRVRVVGKGCAGNEYCIEYVYSVDKSDSYINLNYSGLDFIVVLDPSSLLKMIGTEVDYESDEFYSEFKFKNPRASNICACGKSFAVNFSSDDSQ